MPGTPTPTAPQPAAAKTAHSAISTVHKILDDIGTVLTGLSHIGPEIELVLGLISPPSAAILKTILAAAPAVSHVTGELGGMIEKL